MIKNKLPVRYTGQHFTIDKVLIDDAIKIAKINESDTVIDIGAGKGFLTVHLVRQCTNIIAIENDKSLWAIRKNKLANNTNVKIIDCDFRIRARTVYDQFEIATLEMINHPVLHSVLFACIVIAIIIRII